VQIPGPYDYIHIKKSNVFMTVLCLWG